METELGTLGDLSGSHKNFSWLRIRKVSLVNRSEEPYSSP